MALDDFHRAEVMMRHEKARRAARAQASRSFPYVVARSSLQVLTLLEKFMNRRKWEIADMFAKLDSKGKGTINADHGAHICNKCDPGTFAGKERALHCDSCPAGRFPAHSAGTNARSPF